jgi:hypothetical protein
MTCPVNVSLSGGYPDGRTRRRGQEPAEPPQVRGIFVGFFRQYYRDPRWGDDTTEDGSGRFGGDGYQSCGRTLPIFDSENPSYLSTGRKVFFLFVR